MVVMLEGVIRPSALIIEGGSFLTVRHENEDMLCLPGGKRDRGENTRDALIREVDEETCLSIGGLTYLQTLEGVSPGNRIYTRFPLYRVGKYSGTLAVRGEIAEYLWIGVDNFRQIRVASTIRTHIIPGMIDGNWQTYLKQNPNEELKRQRAMAQFALG